MGASRTLTRLLAQRGVDPDARDAKGRTPLELAREQGNPSITAVEATFTNSLQMPISALNFQVAVPKYMKLQMSPASSNVVPPANSGKVAQLFKLANSLHGQKPIVVKLEIDFTFNGAPRSCSQIYTIDIMPAQRYGTDRPIRRLCHA